MIKEEVEFVFPMIDIAETGMIERKALMEWVVSNGLLLILLILEILEVSKWARPGRWA